MVARRVKLCESFGDAIAVAVDQYGQQHVPMPFAIFFQFYGESPSDELLGRAASAGSLFYTYLVCGPAHFLEEALREGRVLRVLAQ